MIMLKVNVEVLHVSRQMQHMKGPPGILITPL